MWIILKFNYEICIILYLIAEFSKVKQSKDRVYILKFQSSSQKLFFWMQGI